MKAVTMLVVFLSACLGSEISGTWSLKTHGSVAGPTALSVQIEQNGDHLIILKIVAGRLQRRVYSLRRDVQIRAIPQGSEIRFPGGTWIIGSGGELVMNRHLVLAPSQCVAEYGGAN